MKKDKSMTTTLVSHSNSKGKEEEKEGEKDKEYNEKKKEKLKRKKKRIKSLALSKCVYLVDCLGTSSRTNTKLGSDNKKILSSIYLKLFHQRECTNF